MVVNPIGMNPKNYKPLFLDTEFTGLHQKASLISLAIVADTGEYFYAEFDDYDVAAITPWIQENVLNNLLLATVTPLPSDGTVLQGSRTEIGIAVKNWIHGLFTKYKVEKFRFWADVPHYDWVLFCELFGGSLSLPESIDFMVLDLATLLFAKGIDPSASRVELAGNPDLGSLEQHNALYDAYILKTIFDKLTEE